MNVTNHQIVEHHEIVEPLEKISRGLIIAEPWIGKILRGEKTWEMRSSRTSVRGPIALIAKGTGTIVGVADILESIGPLSPDEVSGHEENHRVGAEIYTQDDFKWNHAWVLGQITPLSKPIKYRHKKGAVIWVELDDDVRTELLHQLRNSSSNWMDHDSVSKTTSLCNNKLPRDQYVPFARDGSWFCEDKCSRNGYYTVGEKGDEQRFSSYQSALDHLRKMRTAKWRRPNSNGNWGIVSAVSWAPRK